MEVPPQQSGVGLRDPGLRSRDPGKSQDTGLGTQGSEFPTFSVTSNRPLVHRTEIIQYAVAGPDFAENAVNIGFSSQSRVFAMPTHTLATPPNGLSMAIHDLAMANNGVAMTGHCTAMKTRGVAM